MRDQYAEGEYTYMTVNQHPISSSGQITHNADWLGGLRHSGESWHKEDTGQGEWHEKESVEACWYWWKREELKHADGEQD